MRFLYLNLLMIIVCFSVTAQNLPHRITEQERKMMPAYLESITLRGISTPPEFPVRSAAEWEEMQGVVISWKQYTPVLTEIVRNAVEQGMVYIATESSTSVKYTLNSAGISTDSIIFLEQPTNSVWIRDFGPNNIYANVSDSLFFVDWIYNRPRPLDDKLPKVVAEEIGVKMFETTQFPYKLVGTGGNFMSDGFGMGFSSKLILEESSWHTEQAIRNIFKFFMGIDEYVLMETLPYDDIHHIDMHMKLLNEETLLVAEYPVGVADGPKIEENLQYVLDNYRTCFGTPFKVVRIPSPADEYGNYPDNYGAYRTHTNSLILNKLVLIPIFGGDTDSIALKTYRDAMPGYKVVGIDCNNPIAAGGAIHCITHELGAFQPLLISHQPLTTADAISRGLMVTAYLNHKAGIAKAQVMYRTSSDMEFKAVEMINDIDSTELWSVQIPVDDRADSVLIDYYIKATAVNGKEQVRPMTAPDGFWSFKILNGANIAPVANAGINQIVHKGAIVRLDGSLSVDANGDNITYKWNTDADIELSDNTAENPTFVAPMVDSDTIIQFSLTVSDGLLQSVSDTVDITILKTLLVEDKLQIDWELYPNPASSVVYLDFCSDYPQFIQIVSSRGQLMLSEIPIGNTNLFKINTSEFPAGIYIVKTIFENRVESKRFIIKR